MNSQTKHTINRRSGFTIVELLIVIVVIAILAAITIVGYNGISRQSQQSSMQAGVKQVATLVMNYKTVNGSYPSSLNVLNNGQGVQASSGTQYAYTTIGDTYCISVGTTNGASMSYYISDTTGKPTSGLCTGHESVVAGYPSRLGYLNITDSYGTGDYMLAPIGSVPVGSWMIVVLTTFVNSDSTPPAGWTTLYPRKTTNTLQTAIYAKVKQSGDADNQEFEAAGTNGIAFINAALIWGSNAGPIGSWVLGSYGDRNVNATATTAVTPTIVTTSAKSLVLSIATERTNADETNYTSLTGANPWVWIPQPTGNVSKNQTIAIGYNEQAAAGTSQPMTVTYPNSQTYNATAVQIGIPPAL